MRSTIWPSKDGRLVGLYMWIYNHIYIWQKGQTGLEASIYSNLLSISLGLISSVSPWARAWMIFVINTQWIIVNSGLLCWFHTSSGRRLWFQDCNLHWGETWWRKINSARKQHFQLGMDFFGWKCKLEAWYRNCRLQTSKILRRALETKTLLTTLYPKDPVLQHDKPTPKSWAFDFGAISAMVSLNYKNVPQEQSLE